MIPTLKQKIAWIIEPQAIQDNASPTTTSIDTKGWRHCSIYVRIGATDIAMVALKVQESDDDGSSDAYADVTGLVASGTSGSGRLPTATDDNKTFAFHIDLKGRNRYLDLVATTGDGTAGTYITAYAVLSRGEEHPNSATERGIEWELTLPA
jgi:hypothetical protein